MAGSAISTVIHYGFTLIELSVVLAIIGLIVGGVLVGQDLIRAAEIRSIVSDKERLVTAVYTFNTKYNAIPGDMRDAQSIWGAAAPCTVAQTSAATCNGNGNGLLEGGYGAGTIGNELFLFWKHLANAGVLAGSYSGISDGSTSYATTSNNAPGGKIFNSLWYIQDFGVLTGSIFGFDGVYNNSMEFGLYKVNEDPINPILTAKEMWALDSKIDDGKPGTGLLRAEQYGTNCTAEADGVSTTTYSDTTTAVYRITSTGKVCALLFTNVVKK